MTEQPEALRLADALETYGPAPWANSAHQAAAELRRLHEEVTEQARLLGISAERELSLLARIDRLEKLNAELLEALIQADSDLHLDGHAPDGLFRAPVRAAIRARGQS